MSAPATTPETHTPTDDGVVATPITSICPFGRSKN